MCGSLKREEMGYTVGQHQIPVDNGAWVEPGGLCAITTSEGEKIVAQFNGHARDDKLDDWLSNGWRHADLHVCEYMEGKGEKETKYSVPAGHVIMCVYRYIKGNKVVFNIVTRDAINEEKDIHPRFPLIGLNRY